MQSRTKLAMSILNGEEHCPNVCMSVLDNLKLILRQTSEACNLETQGEDERCFRAIFNEDLGSGLSKEIEDCCEARIKIRLLKLSFIGNTLNELMSPEQRMVCNEQPMEISTEFHHDTIKSITNFLLVSFSCNDAFVIFKASQVLAMYLDRYPSVLVANKDVMSSQLTHLLNYQKVMFLDMLCDLLKKYRKVYCMDRAADDRVDDATVVVTNILQIYACKHKHAAEKTDAKYTFQRLKIVLSDLEFQSELKLYYQVIKLYKLINNFVNCKDQSKGSFCRDGIMGLLTSLLHFIEDNKINFTAMLVNDKSFCNHSTSLVLKILQFELDMSIKSSKKELALKMINCFCAKSSLPFQEVKQFLGFGGSALHGLENDVLLEPDIKGSYGMSNIRKFVLVSLKACLIILRMMQEKTDES